MQKLLSLLPLCLFFNVAIAQNSKIRFDATDIDLFWKAYNAIVSSSDSATQYQLLKTLYLNKGSVGLNSMIAVRNYGEKDFIDGITQHPQFWKSIKPNMLQAKRLFPEVQKDMEQLIKAYPAAKPTTVYFTVGAFRSGGTTHNGNVLLGCELSLADAHTVVNELPAWRQPFYKNQHPIAEIGLLCTHEYVHIQQKPLIENLLSMCLYEGVAEFVSCNVTGKKSTTPAIDFGKANEKRVVNQFVADLFIMANEYNWLYGENRNDLKIRDLGYYIGYEICERYYLQAADKTKALQELIELDYTNDKEVERIVDLSKLLPKPLAALYADYETVRPTVVALTPFENGSKAVKPGITKITIHFSEQLLTYNTGVDFGPLGQAHFPQLKPERIFSADGKSWTFEADLKPNQHYQILISNNFRKTNGIRLKPYLIDFFTTE